jgi:GNAT superfamily N-acetyltransferase
MSQSHPIIVEVTSIPKSELASLHLKYLPTAFSGFAGLRLLELYYNALSQVDDAFGWTAVVDERVAGFACAIRSMQSIQHILLTRSLVRSLQWSVIQILCKPQLLADLVRRLVPSAAATKQWQRPVDWREWYTYRPLVVDEAYRKYRLADLLTRCVVEEAARRGVPGLISIVQRLNSQARVTHVRNGFREVWKGEDCIVFAREFGKVKTS